MHRTAPATFVQRVGAVSIAFMLAGASVTGCGSPMRNVKTPASTPVAPGTASTGSVPPGTQVPIRVVQAMSSRDTDSTEPVTTKQQGFVVAEDVRGKAGVVLISSGTPVVADVTRKLHERLGREGKLTIRFRSTTATNGATVKLSDTPNRFTGRKRLGGVIAGSILLFPIGLLFLLLQGGDVTLESGSGLTATVVG
jgi:hypothetical protein